MNYPQLLPRRILIARPEKDGLVAEDKFGGYFIHQ